MPKQKTKRSAAKRFKKTATGYKHKQAGVRHLNTSKSQKRKRNLRGLKMVSASDAPALKRILPY